MGHARLRPEGDDASEVFGGIVDVSAGGTRLRVRPGIVVLAGTVFVVDLEVAVPETRGPIPPVKLRGRAVSLRFDPGEDATGAELSLRFEEPLRVCDGIGVPLPAFAIGAAEHVAPARARSS